jgi:lipoprotein-anchoring transpeptidase ErfK/SrfK
MLMNKIRLGLCVCVLAMGAVCLWLAQEQIALAAEMVQQSGGEFDSSSLLRLDPAFALAGENLFALDDQDESMLDSDLSLDPSIISDPMDVAQLAQSSLPIPPAQPNPVTTDAAAAAPGWPKTTAQTTLAGRSSHPASSGHWVDVNLSKQQVTAYNGSTPIKTVWTSTGTRRHPTVVGTFHVWLRLRSTTMSGGSYQAGDHYRLPGVPWVQYFYRGFALHGTYWHRNFGHPMSHGCVNLTIDDSAWFYNFGFLGMAVRTHY